MRLALLGTAIFAIVALGLTSLPVLQISIREDRMKLFVEQFTRGLADQVGHALAQCRARVHDTASRLALHPAARGGRPGMDALRTLNAAVNVPISDAVPQGIFDLLVVVRRDGVILMANSEGRFARPLDTRALAGRHILEFHEESDAFLGAFGGVGAHDWYRSSMVALVRPDDGADLSRNYAIALAEAIPGSDYILVAVVNWEAVQRVLDSIEHPLRDAGFASGYAFMFGRDGETIIGHKFRDPSRTNNYGTRLTADHKLPELARAVAERQSSYRYEYPPGTRKVSGLARVDDPDFRWTVGLGINDADVVAPFTDLALRLAAIGGVVILTSLLLAHFTSRRLTMDLRELMRSAQRIADGRLGERVEVRSRDEVGQLAAAFNDMTTALVRRDAVILEQQFQLMERMRLDQELQIAAEVQRRLFPQFHPKLRSMDYVGYCQPARTVSGDFYDFLPLGSEKLGLLVADVSGKGISAALLMASLHACIRTHAAVFGEECGAVIATLNSLFYQATDPDRFATVFYAVYDDVSRRLTYVNAGHFPPLLLRSRNGRPAAVTAAHAEAGSGQAAVARAVAAEESDALFECLPLEFGTPLVGVFDTLPALQQTVELAPGDWLLIFTDGVLEATNVRGEEFGQERLVELVTRHPDCTAVEMREAILGELSRHAGGSPQSDDITLIVARVL